MRTLLALPLLCCACARPDGLAEIPVASASLSDFDVAQFVVTSGVEGGNAKLHLVEPDGTKHDVSLTITGFLTGFAMSLGFAALEDESDFDLSAVDDPHGDDLLGPYDGFTADGAMLIGAGFHSLENDRHAVVKLGGFELDMGMDLLVGQEWLNFNLSPETDCGNGADDDGDGLADCADDDCGCTEQACDDGADDDGDGLVDCADPDCSDACSETGTRCADGIDNDHDEFLDCADSDCASSFACQPRDAGEVVIDDSEEGVPDAGGDDAGVDAGFLEDAGP